MVSPLLGHYAANVTGVIVTSNNKIDGSYLPDDDRRHHVVWSECHKEDFTPEYWKLQRHVGLVRRRW
jgi:hypothetical protein